MRNPFRPGAGGFLASWMRLRSGHVAAAAVACMLWQPPGARAQLTNSEAVVDLVTQSVGPGGAGIGWLLGSERSLYRDAGQRSDILPLYLYEGERVLLRSDRVGLKFEPDAHQALNVYLRRRLEGFPLTAVPASLAGMKPRAGGLDVGLGWRLRLGEGSTVHANAYQNIGNEARGQELSIGTHTDWQLGRLTLRPALVAT